jgi:hypothetical protein
MRQARKRIAKNGSVVGTSVDTFMEYLQNNENLFRLLLREKTGVSQQFRTAIRAEIDHFIVELTEDLRRLGDSKSRPISNAKLVAEAMVTIVFNQGADALDCSPKDKQELKQNLKLQLRMLLLGAELAQKNTTNP